MNVAAVTLTNNIIEILIGAVNPSGFLIGLEKHAVVSDAAIHEPIGFPTNHTGMKPKHRIGWVLQTTEDTASTA
jgi:hypothetical protein